MKSFFEEFKKFALRGNVVDLAVGIIIGAAFTGVTNALVNNILTPPLGLLLGGIDFSDLGVTLAGDAVIQYGLFIEALISFTITAFALFLLVRFINRLTTRARKEQEEGTAPPAQKSSEVMLLEEIRDLMKGSASPAAAHAPSVAEAK
jgi:large conductance mechanosensitive channel